MNRLTWIAIIGAFALAGCKDKTPKPGPATTGSGSAQPSGDAKWLDRLPTASGTNPVQLQFAAGLVRVDASGTITVATAPTAAATDARRPGADPFVAGKPVKLDELAAALGLPPVTPRTPSAFDAGDGSAGSNAAADPNDVAFARLGHAMVAAGAPAPAHRTTSAFAVAHPHEVNGGVVVFADAQAPAATLVDVLAQTGGFLAVRDGEGLGALSLALDRHAPAFVPPTHGWVEARLGATVEVHAIPGPATPGALDKLAAALPPNTDAVDVLVAAETKVQDLVSALAQLRAAKVLAVGFGRAPAAGSPEATARAAVGPRVVAWDILVAKAADKSVHPQYEAALAGALEPIRVCYAALKKPELAGTAQVELAIGANAKIDAADATGVPKPLGDCIGTALRALTWPSGGTRVSAKLGFVPR